MDPERFHLPSITSNRIFSLGRLQRARLTTISSTTRLEVLKLRGVEVAMGLAEVAQPSRKKGRWEGRRKVHAKLQTAGTAFGKIIAGRSCACVSPEPADQVLSNYNAGAVALRNLHSMHAALIINLPARVVHAQKHHAT